MFDSLDLISALLGASVVVTLTSRADDGRRRRLIALGVALTATMAVLFVRAPAEVLALAFVALVVSALGTAAWLREHRPVRLTADERRLQRLVFRDLAPAQVRRLVRAGRTVDAAAGTVLLRAGKAPDQVLLILRGEARVELDGELKTVLVAGRFAGEMGWVTGQATSAAIVAADDVHYVKWTRGDLDALFARDPALRSLFSVAVAQDLAAKLRFVQM